MKVVVSFTEHVTYEHTFEIDLDGLDPDEFLRSTSDVHELMDDQNAWDQLTQQDWLSGSVNLREIDDARVPTRRKGDVPA